MVCLPWIKPTEMSRSPGPSTVRPIRVAWMVGQKAGLRYYTRVDVWLGSGIKLEELRIPANVEVVSGGEIEKFIAERQGKQKK